MRRSSPGATLAGLAARRLLTAVMVASGSAAPASARLVSVGPGGTYATLDAAINGRTYGAGDTIAVLPGTHTVMSMLRPLGSGVAGSPIVVRGVGSPRPIVSAAALANHKAFWDVEQGNRWWVFENLSVRDMRGAQTNARGFFLVGCSDIVIQDVEITNCWNGIMTGTGATRVTVQFCDIHDNGGLQGPAHNIYLSSGSDHVIQHNWIHDAHYGLNFKDRTRNLKLLYNWIENADQGGYEVSLAGQGTLDRGDALVLGNVIVKSASSAQQTHLLRFEDGRVGTLTMIHNTIVAQPKNTVIYSMATTTTLRNNIVAGGKTLFARDTSARTLIGAHNWVTSGVSLPAEIAGTLTGAAPGFADAAAGDLQLAAGSACIDAGDGQEPLPAWQYAASAGRAARAVHGSAPDLGAFERPGSASGSEPPPPSEPPADTTPPAAPAGLQAVADGPSAIALSWIGPSDAASYVVERAATAAGPFTTRATPTATSYTDTGLQAGTTHVYRVRARDAAGNLSQSSATATATTAAAASSMSSATLAVTKGTLVSGSGADLAVDDGAVALVQSAGAGRKHGADVVVDLAAVAGPGFGLVVHVAASAPAKTTLYLWRWSHRRWQRVGRLGGEEGSLEFEDGTRYVAADGAVRARFAATAKTSFTLAFDLVGVRALGDDDAGDDALAARLDDDAPAADTAPSLSLLGAAPVCATSVRFAVRGALHGGVDVLDVRGRLVARLEARESDGSARVATWDGRDISGRRAARGLYWARARFADADRVLRVVWLGP